MGDGAVLLEMRGISKRFPGVLALDGVDFTLRAGEIHALMGENGAGKSTLIKALTGVYPRDAGEIKLNGEPFLAKSPGHAQELGVSTVYQEVNLIPTLSVAENIYLGRQPMKFGRIDWKSIKRGAEEALRRLDITVDVSRTLSSCSIAIQQMVAIARALDLSAKLLILDEPTSSLDPDEVERLFALMRRLKEDGLGIIFVTHFLGQVYEVCDRITVLRNGRLVGEYETAELSRLDLIAKMLGKNPEELPEMARSAENGAESRAEPFLRCRGVARRGSVEPLDLDVVDGEVLGLAGLLGSGRSEVARLLFGIEKADRGEITLEGKPIALTTARRAIGAGFAFCPEDRKTHGIIPDLSVRENIILALQASKGFFNRLSYKAQTEITDNYIKALSIVTPDADQAVKYLSGGNQQKVILARWLASNPRFLILDEPTRGIDVGSKSEIEKLVLQLAAEGKAVLLISSELDEVARCSTRVAVLRDRHKVGELSGVEVSENAIMQTIARKEATIG
ncbi:MAG TPA: sugar ABC transporter ATP-binding protein [Armatimonadota bacterium]|jgi:simple sugar transport system ATP-binding protein